MAAASDYTAYLQKMVNLNVIDKMTKDLDEQLQGSFQMMSQIQAMFDTIPKQNLVPIENPGEQDDFYKFLDSDISKLMMPDMENVSSDLDLDNIIASMKAHAENLMKNTFVPQTQTCTMPIKEEIKSLQLDQYATNLEQLGKRLANIKLSKCEDVKNRNPELEEKLAQLCLDVDTFTKVCIVYLVFNLVMSTSATQAMVLS